MLREIIETMKAFSYKIQQRYQRKCNGNKRKSNYFPALQAYIHLTNKIIMC